MRRTEQQMAFVEAYVENGGNATKAAKEQVLVVTQAMPRSWCGA